MIERRTSERNRCLLAGRVVPNANRSMVDCAVRNLSDTGALIEVSDAVLMPDRFDLHVVKRGMSYRSVIRWRQGGTMGVTFISDNPSAKPEPTSLEMAAQLAQNRATINKLKARINQLTEAG